MNGETELADSYSPFGRDRSSLPGGVHNQLLDGIGIVKHAPANSRSDMLTKTRTYVINLLSVLCQCIVEGTPL